LPWGVLPVKNTPHTPSSKVRAHEGIVGITCLASIPSSRNSVPNRMIYVASRRGQKLDQTRPQAQAAWENAGESLLSLRELIRFLAAIEASSHHCAGCSHSSEPQ
jgi:hypothetical protein